MISALLLAIAVHAAPPAQAKLNYHPLLQETAEAIHAGRLDQARLMVTRATAEGAIGPEVDRLLGDIAYASGNYAQALARYRLLANGQHPDRAICERAGIAAIKTRAFGEASHLIACAIKDPAASFRAWDARGVLADHEGDWAAADDAYGRAARISPDDAAIVNNQGWSMLLRGDWVNALRYFKRAAVLDPKSTRIRDNLELVSSALATDLPRRRPGESASEWAERLNDAGVAAELLAEKKRAVAAFTQALQASGSWYSRAANNLEKAREE
jgi:Flp pilus assembly protein TadD